MHRSVFYLVFIGLFSLAESRGQLPTEFQCVTLREARPGPEQRLAGLASEQGVIRVFRMAVAATGEFTEYHGGKEPAVAAVRDIIGRVSSIFERELGVRFELVEGFEELIFTHPEADPYSTNEPSLELLREAQQTFDERVGTVNYDLGIVLTRGTYGLNHLASVCNPQLKGASCLGLPEPNGGEFHVNLLAHELAHQFGAEHTFNSDAGLCGERRREWHAYEPGTGSTLLGYAGLPCDDDSFQAGNDAYFHSESLKQILDFLNSPAASCAQVIETGNQAPMVHAGPEFTIPIQTPFALTATGSDPDGDQVFYCWEQRDRGPAQSLGEPDNGSSPLFRSYPPVTSPTRFFPALPYILGNEQPPAETLPSTTRVLRFRVTARDSQNNGALSWADTQIFAVDSAGPFRVVSHGGGEQIEESTEVRWDPAGTAEGPVEAEAVRITLSLDGGYTFPIVLTESTPNDGGETVVLPNASSSSARIKVAAVGNIFFDVNDSDLTLNSGVITIRSVQRAGPGIRMVWNANEGESYRVEASPSLEAPDWETVQQVVAGGPSAEAEIMVGHGMEFFRVVRE